MGGLYIYIVVGAIAVIWCLYFILVLIPKLNTRKSTISAPEKAINEKKDFPETKGLTSPISNSPPDTPPFSILRGLMPITYRQLECPYCGSHEFTEEGPVEHGDAQFPEDEWGKTYYSCKECAGIW